jgi:hypothetical protein
VSESAKVVERDREAEWALIEASIARLRGSVMAVVFGLASGMGLFVATLWLVIRDGPLVGRTLGLLRNYFPGYSVTWAGAFVGFAYAAALGALVGWSLAFIYNRIVNRRHPA